MPLTKKLASFVAEVRAAGNKDLSSYEDPNKTQRQAQIERESINYAFNVSKSMLQPYSNLPKTSKRHIFEDTDVIPEGMRTAFDACKRWTPAAPVGVTLIGPSGCGKTHLFHCMINKYIDSVSKDFETLKANPYSLKYFSWPLLYDEIKFGDEAAEKRLTAIKPTHLFLDDISISLTQASKDKLFGLVEERASKGRKTSFALDIDPEKASEIFDRRFVSRLQELTAVFVIKNARDRRVKTGQENRDQLKH